MVFPADTEAQTAIDKLISIPNVPFNDINILKNPNINIGSKA